jgi:hypothetical protein
MDNLFIIKEEGEMARIFIGLMLIGLLVFSASGCVAVLAAGAGGAGTAAWLSGKLSDEMSASYDDTISATKSALKSLDMPITKETKKKSVAQIMSKNADGAEVWIDIRPITTKTTKVEVRVGAMGNKEASSRIIEAIKNRI